ncbi:hypothetical protein C8R43DRAFT_1112430 [Mycena crocata]|nr:hypothetical protein C8R43DRAFT_1112430 [Mycena crocata]
MPYSAPTATAGGTGHRRSRAPHFHFHADLDGQNDSSSDDLSQDNSSHPSIGPNSNSVRRARSASTPAIFYNGKPLKSSLKSISVARHPLRSRSSSTPSASSARTSISESGKTELGSVWTEPEDGKNVHFPSPDAGLATVVVFNRSARPAEITLPREEQTETETETETDSTQRWSGGVVNGAHSLSRNEYPFPRVQRTSMCNAEPQRQEFKWRYDMYAPGVPRRPEPGSMLVLEGLRLVQGNGKDSCDVATAGVNELALRGTLLARNAAFEKHISVRFTLDEWCTTNDVSAQYVGSVGSAFPFTTPPPTGGLTDAASLMSDKSDEGTPGFRTETPFAEQEAPGPGWDRFVFSISLTHCAYQRASLTDSTSPPSSGAGSSRGVKIRPGLMDHEIELAVRFFAPSIRAGDVAPYAWCDRATLTDGGSPPAGRAWVGGGGGGAGEWWDNNAGKNYRVNFRVVTESSQSPALAAVPTLNGIHAHTFPPSPPLRNPHAQTLAAKLGRLRIPKHMANTVTESVGRRTEDDDDSQSSATSEEPDEDKEGTPPTSPVNARGEGSHFSLGGGHGGKREVSAPLLLPARAESAQ